MRALGYEKGAQDRDPIGRSWTVLTERSVTDRRSELPAVVSPGDAPRL